MHNSITLRINSFNFVIKFNFYTIFLHLGDRNYSYIFFFIFELAYSLEKDIGVFSHYVFRCLECRDISSLKLVAKARQFSLCCYLTHTGSETQNGFLTFQMEFCESEYNTLARNLNPALRVIFSGTLSVHYAQIKQFL